MKREQQKQLKQLKTALPKIIKELAGKKKLKKKDFMLYGTNEDMFFDCQIFVSVNDNDECICSTTENMKPLWMDDLLWELLDMKENSKEPLSLRAIGAFTVSGAEIYEKATVLAEWTEEELTSIVEEYVDHFCNSISATDFSVFEEKLSNGYHHELREALYHINNKDYHKALEIVGEESSGPFSNGSINIFDAIREYCHREKLDVQMKESQNMARDIGVR